MARSMKERLEGGDAEGWRPEPGDVVIGVVDEVTSREGDYGPYPLIVIEQEDGELVAVHAFHTVLKNEIEAQAPSVGDEIGVKYLGTQEPKGGLKKGQDPFHAYRVRLDRKSPKGSTVPTPPRAATEFEKSGDGNDFVGEEPF